MGWREFHGVESDACEAQRASAEALTAQAVAAFEQIDSLWTAVLDAGGHGDIDSLRQRYEPPPFDRIDLISPIVPPRVEQPAPEPVFNTPPKPTGVRKMFGKRAHRHAVEVAHAEWQTARAQWADYVDRVLPEKNAASKAEHAAAETARLGELAVAKEHYDRLCADVKQHIAESNALLDEIAKGLRAGDPDAIEDFIGLVLSHSDYPAVFEVDHDYSFDSDEGEVTVDVSVPSPDALSLIKKYDYDAATNETREVAATQDEQRKRYNRAVTAVAVRTFYEVFAAHRHDHVKTASVAVRTTTVDPATGMSTDFVFITATVDRSEFARFDLAHVDPADILDSVRSAVSKNPFGLQTVSTSS